MNRCLVASAIALSAICPIAAQQAPEQPKFEVASVKRAAQCTFDSSLGPGEVVLKGIPLKPVLVEAFKVSNEQITGPSWLDQDCFDIFGKMPEGATRDQIPAMLQALLAERFQLAAHKEDRPRPVYAMVVDKGGPKCKQSDTNLNFMSKLPAGTIALRRGGGGIKGSMTMASLAHYLSDRGTVRCRTLPGSQENMTSTYPGRRIRHSNPRRVLSQPHAQMPTFPTLPQSTSLPPSGSRWD